MNTRILLDHEPVADGGFFARATLFIEGMPADEVHGTSPRGTREAHPARPAHLSARNVHVSFSPGRDAEYMQVTHAFESRGAGDLLTVSVGDVYDVDRVRIRMEALVGAASDASAEADVGRIVVYAAVHTRRRTSVELRAVTLAIRLSSIHGCRVQPHVRTIPCTVDSSSGAVPSVELPLVDTQDAM